MSEELGKSIYEKARIEILVELVIEKHISIEVASEKLNITREEFKRIMETKE